MKKGIFCCLIIIMLSATLGAVSLQERLSQQFPLTHFPIIQNQRAMHMEYFKIYPAFWLLCYQAESFQASQYRVENNNEGTWTLESYWTAEYYEDGHLSQLNFVGGSGPEAEHIRLEVTPVTVAGQTIPGQILCSFLQDEEWVVYARDTYTYDNQGIMTNFAEDYWAMDSWIPAYRSTTTLDNGHVAQILTESFDYESSSWMNEEKTSLSWADGNIATIIYQTWTNDAWLNDDNTAYTYDANGIAYLQIDMIWGDNSWTNNLRTTDTINGDIISHETTEEWIQNGWVLSGQVLFTISGNRYTQLLEQSFDGTNWVDESRTTLSYSGSDADDNTVTKPALNVSVYPNPFNPTTNIVYSLPTSGDVTLTIYNLRGETVKTLVTERQTAGEHRIAWNGTDAAGQSVASGMYFYRLTGNGQATTGKLMLMQ
jgi:hypothetical protein